MKAKLKVKDVKRFEIACEVADVKIEEAQDFGSVTTAIVNYKHAQQLFDLGSLSETVDTPSMVEARNYKEEED